MKKEFSLAESMTKLQEIEATFQSSDVNLEISLAKYKEAVELAAEIKKYLTEVENTLEKIDMSALS